MDRLILREELDDDSQPTLAGRILTIRICTYGRVYRVNGSGRTIMRERVQPGAFKEPLARPRGALRFRHIGERPGDDDQLDNFYGVMTGLTERDGSLFGDFEVFAGEREDKLLRLVQSGAVTGASMTAVIKGSKPGRDAGGPLVDITRVGSLDAVSITPKPSYDDAGVVAIREQPPDRVADTAKLQAARAETAAFKARLYADMERWGKPGK